MPQRRPQSRPTKSASTAQPASAEDLQAAFEALWRDLFASPIHLDATIAQRPKALRGRLFQLIQPILLRPVTTARVLEMELKPGEPWSLSPLELTHWEAAREMARRLIAGQRALRDAVHAAVPEEPLAEFPPPLRTRLTPDLAAKLCAHPALSLRAVRELGAEGLLRALRREKTADDAARLPVYTPFGVVLGKHAPVASSQLHREGKFEIQDSGSQLMSLFALWPGPFSALLQAQPGLPISGDAPAVAELETKPITVVDACAGAGGKSLAMADALGGKGRVYAYDVSQRRLTALRQRAKRAGLTNVQSVLLTLGEEESVVKRFRRRADVVLVDAPCGGWGVLRRNPDMKWRFEAEALERLAELQQRLLAVYADLVRPGGRLVYGVCTFRPEETTEIVQRFLAEQPDFKPGPGGYLGPDAEGACDGFFMQVMVRQ